MKASLSDYLIEVTAAYQAFSWATHNCCHFAAGWVRFAGAGNPMHDLPPTPTLRAALRLLARLGGGLRAAWSRQLGSEPIAATLAQAGDVVLLPSNAAGTGYAVGVCTGRQAAAQASDGAIVFVPMTAALCAWRLARPHDAPIAL